MHSGPIISDVNRLRGTLLLQLGALDTQNAGLFWGCEGKPGTAGTIFYFYPKLLNCLGSQGNNLIATVRELPTIASGGLEGAP